MKGKKKISTVTGFKFGGSARVKKIDHTRVPDSTNQTNAVSHQGPP